MKRQANNLKTQAALARRFGVHLHSVANWRKNPLWPFPDGRFPVGAVAAWRFLHVLKQATPGVEPDFAGYAKAMRLAGLAEYIRDEAAAAADAKRLAVRAEQATRFTEAKVRLIEFANEETAGAFIDRDTSDRLLVAILRELQTRVDRWVVTLPDKLAGQTYAYILATVRGGWDAVCTELEALESLDLPSDAELGRYRTMLRGAR